jgi:L-lactate dehydrogenase
MAKIAIVGAGAVGSTVAYAAMIRGLATELVLIDAKREKAEGEAMDLNHGLPFVPPAKIWASDYSDCQGAKIVVLSAGVTSLSGETRLDLLERNSAIFKEIIPQIARYNPEGILLVITNPVDVLTYLTVKLSHRPPGRVIGSGTVLDSARFRYLLSEHCGVDPRNVHAYIIGEHGDSEVPVWSLANISGVRLEEYCLVCDRGCTRAEREEIFQRVRRAGSEIIERKGATYYAIGLAATTIMESILRDQKTVLPVSHLIEGQYGLREVCLSLPSIVGRTGVEKILELPLSEIEMEGLRRSARILKEAATSLVV